MTRPIRMHSLLALSALIGAAAPADAGNTLHVTNSGPRNRPGARMSRRLPEDAQFNGRGDYLSPRNDQRRAFAPMSGRQWVRLRRSLRRGA